MDKQVIIAISREYGSAGHEIAEKVARDLGLKLYDRNMLD
ncbi:MAG: cytidylate kinase-like family protein, partial [Lachnospiraceae bacterium]|nr:cytidylate kinase-like family protein [Lachnospiraceae bacterium]